MLNVLMQKMEASSQSSKEKNEKIKERTAHLMQSRILQRLSSHVSYEEPFHDRQSDLIEPYFVNPLRDGSSSGLNRGVVRVGPEDEVESQVDEREAETVVGSTLSNDDVSNVLGDMLLCKSSLRDRVCEDGVGRSDG